MILSCVSREGQSGAKETAGGGNVPTQITCLTVPWLPGGGSGGGGAIPFSYLDFTFLLSHFLSVPCLPSFVSNTVLVLIFSFFPLLALWQASGAV